MRRAAPIARAARRGESVAGISQGSGVRHRHPWRGTSCALSGALGIRLHGTQTGPWPGRKLKSPPFGELRRRRPAPVSRRLPAPAGPPQTERRDRSGTGACATTWPRPWRGSARRGAPARRAHRRRRCDPAWPCPRRSACRRGTARRRHRAIRGWSASRQRQRRRGAPWRPGSCTRARRRRGRSDRRRRRDGSGVGGEARWSDSDDLAWLRLIGAHPHGVRRRSTATISPVVPFSTRRPRVVVVVLRREDDAVAGMESDTTLRGPRRSRRHRRRRRGPRGAVARRGWRDAARRCWRR